MMNCPKCNSEMETVTYHNIEIERCKKCRGMWFDMLEHEDLKKIKGAEVIDIGDPELGKEYNKIKDIICPKCKNIMISLVNLNQKEIWYESCPTCYGVFFDAGEFKDYKEQNVLDFFKDLFEKEEK